MKKLIYIFLSVILLASCVEEDYFGYSKYGNIKSISVSNQASNSVIDNDNHTVTVEIPGGVDLENITINELTLSAYAKSSKKVGDILNLNTAQTIVVTAEDGETYTWTIETFIASKTPQFSNGDMNLWYKTTSGYYEPGESASNTIWGTGNPGTQILNKLATVPEDLGNGNYAAKMITLDNGFLAATFGAPIAAGSIFTGVFNSDKINPSDPEAAIDFGTLFSGRPKTLKFKYRYTPGGVNKDKDGNVLSYSDACDIYAYLEVRAGEKIERLATAWFRSSDIQSDLSTMEIPFVYGELDSTYPDYMKPSDNSYVSADSASFILPTHITFVASSSYDGASFAGAVGSELLLDDVELVYAE